MDFNKLDRIVLTFNDLYKIRQWHDIHFEQLDKETYLPLEECLVEIHTSDIPEIKALGEGYQKVTIHFRLESELTMHCSVFIGEEDEPDFSWTIDDDFYKGEEKKVKWKSGFKKMKMPEKMAQQQALFYTMALIQTFAYIANVTENVIERTEVKTITKKAKKKGKGKNQKNRQVKISVTRYEFNFKGGESGRKNERHTPAWTVRGHWRTYKKSGKRIWVKSHVKGDIENVEGKTYKV